MVSDKLRKKTLAILERAKTEKPPSYILVAFSGGDDSITALNLAFELLPEIGLAVDGICHVHTNTGVKQTLEFVRETAATFDVPYYEKSAGDAFQNQLMKKGFFGKGRKAHQLAYQLLKATPLRKICSFIRQRRRNFNIWLINGARVDESTNRAANMKRKGAISVDPAAKTNVWVNIIHDWSKVDCLNYLKAREVKRNPVSLLCHRSGECMCGTMQSKDEGDMVAALYPNWGQWREEMNQIAHDAGFPWSWGDGVPSYWQEMKDGQIGFDFMPMCVGCESGVNKEF